MITPSKETPGRVLVVDDDPVLLGRMLDSLRPLAPAWQAEGASSGSQALEAFARRPYHAILADLSMPGMEGGMCLQEIMARHPATLRILLFGEGERNQALQCLAFAHQFLAKPFDPAYLGTLLQGACQQGTRIGNDHVRELVTRIGQLPALPELYHEIHELLESEHCTTERLGTTIARDIAATAMVLKLANSAYFSLRHPVTTPVEATAYLGVDLIKALVLAHGLFGQVGMFHVPGFTLQHLWNHSLSVAVAARRIAEAEGLGPQACSDSFTAGILHDIGLLILASRFPEDYARVLDLTRLAGGDLESAERHVFGATHGDVGAYLLHLWGLPGPLVEACAFHHQPRLIPGRSLTPSLAVHIADALETEHPEHQAFATARLDLSLLESLSLGDRLPRWRDMVRPPKA